MAARSLIGGHPHLPGRTYKLRKDTPDHRDFKFDDVKVALPHLPSSVDLSDKMPPVLDQGDLGACISNAASNCMRYLLKKEAQKEFQPSRLYIYYNGRVFVEKSSPKDDTGLTVRDVCKSIQKYHACSEEVWPYDISKFDDAPSLAAYNAAKLEGKFTYSSVNHTLTSIKRVLSQGFPILFGIMVYESLEMETTLTTGEVPMPNKSVEQQVGGHGIALVGYDDAIRKFTFLNSWGTKYGLPNKKGYFHIPYDYVMDKDLSFDFWVMTYFGSATPAAPVIPTPQPFPLVPVQAFKLISAIYGSRSKRVDVTAKFSKIVDTNGNIIKQIGQYPYSYNTFFGIDPDERVAKDLLVTYCRSGEDETIKFKENAKISLP